MRDPKAIFGHPSGVRGIFPPGAREEAAPEGLRSIASPYDGEPVACVETAGLRQVEERLETAYRLFRNRAQWLSRVERIGVLERAARLTLREKDSLAFISTCESGTPLLYTQNEAQRAINSLRACVEYLRSEAGEVIPMGSTSESSKHIAFTQHEPVGVVVITNETHHPISLIIQQVAAAIAAGCPVIVNPAGDAPLSTLMFADILQRAGLPPDRCQVLVTDNEESTDALVTDRRVGLFSYVGCRQRGWKLRSMLAPGVRCVLELSGAAPMILMRDSNQEQAMKSIIQGGFCHAGQRNASAQFIFVPDLFARDFAAALAERAARLRIGDPRDADTQLGSLIRPAEARCVDEWVGQALEGGAELMTGGSTRGNSSFEPTVLLNPPVDAQVSQQEIHGPVVCVNAYAELESVLELVNDMPFALQVSVFTENLDSALRVLRHIDASAVLVNENTAYRSERMPFAGLRQSGLGVNGIPYSIENMQVTKMLLLHSQEL